MSERASELPSLVVTEYTSFAPYSPLARRWKKEPREQERECMRVRERDGAEFLPAPGRPTGRRAVRPAPASPSSSSSSSHLRSHDSRRESKARSEDTSRILRGQDPCSRRPFRLSLPADAVSATCVVTRVPVRENGTADSSSYNLRICDYFDMYGARDNTRRDTTESAAYYCRRCRWVGRSLAALRSRLAVRARWRRASAAGAPRRAVRRGPRSQSPRGRPFVGARACAPASVDNVAGTPPVQTRRWPACRAAPRR